MNVRRIAAINTGSYKYDFAYIELSPLQPIGIYENSLERIAETERGEGYFPYYWEEYAIVDGEHLVTRSEYDDGSAIINGQIQRIAGRSELRGRYVTSYNFIIAAGGSPILNHNFDQELEGYLNAMLRGEDHLETIALECSKLPTGNF